MIQAVLFDLDGTLAHTAPDLALALNRLRGEEGLPALPVAAVEPVASAGARGMLNAGLGVTPEDPRFPELRDRFLAHYEKEVCVDSRLFDGMPELLEQLERRGLRWGIVTNKAMRFTDPLAAALGLVGRAACIVSGDTTPRFKPHPDSLLHAAATIGVAPAHCLYVGDDMRDVQAARAAGMAILAAGYGYLSGGDPHAWGADAVISHPREVLKYLGPSPSVG
jgi:N-acetyl-D-muramate 6-phosphate phosphatase